MADSTEARIVVREWRTGDDGLTWADGDILFNDAWALTEEHNAVVSELRAALDTASGFEKAYLQTMTRAEAAEADRDRLREALELAKTCLLVTPGVPKIVIERVDAALQGASPKGQDDE